MKTYIIKVSPERSNPDNIFKDRKRILWNHLKSYKYEVGDELYMYITSNVDRIRFKVKVLRMHVPATEEDLYNPTWLHESDLKRQIAANDNDEYELIREYSDEESEKLSASYLEQRGIKIGRGSTDVTGMVFF